MVVQDPNEGRQVLPFLLSSRSLRGRCTPPSRPVTSHSFTSLKRLESSPVVFQWTSVKVKNMFARNLLHLFPSVGLLTRFPPLWTGLPGITASITAPPNVSPVGRGHVEAPSIRSLVCLQDLSTKVFFTKSRKKPNHKTCFIANIFLVVVASAGISVWRGRWSFWRWGPDLKIWRLESFQNHVEVASLVFKLP